MHALRWLGTTRCALVDVVRVGGPGDGGVDVRATLVGPGGAAAATLLVQCKSSASRKSSVVHVRELEGVVAARPSGSVLGVLVHSRGLSPWCLRALHASTQPLAGATVEGDAVATLVVNKVAAAMLPRLVVGSTLEAQGRRRLPHLVWSCD